MEGWWKLMSTADCDAGSRMADHGTLTQQELKTLGKHFRSIGDGELLRALRKLCGLAASGALVSDAGRGRARLTQLQRKTHRKQIR